MARCDKNTIPIIFGDFVSILEPSKNNNKKVPNMPGQRPILAMSFIASLGITFEVLACTLPKDESNFWPLLIYIFYVMLPLPVVLSKRIIKDTVIGMNDGGAAKVRDCALFITAGIMVSSIALPIVLARSPSGKPIVSIR